VHTAHIVRTSAQGIVSKDYKSIMPNETLVWSSSPPPAHWAKRSLARLQFRLQIGLTTYAQSSAENKIKPRTDNHCRFRTRQTTRSRHDNSHKPLNNIKKDYSERSPHLTRSQQQSWNEDMYCRRMWRAKRPHKAMWASWRWDTNPL
jgi:hypothetical protein